MNSKKISLYSMIDIATAVFFFSNCGKTTIRKNQADWPSYKKSSTISGIYKNGLHRSTNNNDKTLEKP